MLYILYQSSVFDNTACLIKSSLEAKGYHARFTTRADSSPDSYYIILGAHQLSGPLPKNYEVYQFEQVNAEDTPQNWFTGEHGQRYIQLLKGARRVYDYSSLNCQLLEERFELQPVFLPLGYTNQPLASARGNRRYPVSFLGSMNPRRKQILEGLSMPVQTNISCWREQRSALLKQTAVALNIHYYPNATLETTRIAELIEAGCLVVSEPSSDPDLDLKYRNIVIFCPKEQMDATINDWLKRDKDRQRFVEEAQTHYRQLSFTYPPTNEIREAGAEQPSPSQGLPESIPEPDLLRFRQAPAQHTSEGSVLKLKSMADSDLPSVSIVTITRNRPQLIKLAIANYYRFNYPTEKMEWVVIDDSPTDQIRELLPKAAKYVWLPSNEPLSIAEKRNIGVNKASHDIIVHMDDDDYYFSQSINARVRLLVQNKDQGVGCVGCQDYGVYHLMDNYSFRLNTNHLSEASMCYFREFWQSQPFEDDVAGGGESIPFLKNRRKQVMAMPFEFNFVALTHGNNITKGLRSAVTAEGNRLKSNTIFKNLDPESQRLIIKLYRALRGRTAL